MSRLCYIEGYITKQLLNDILKSVKNLKKNGVCQNLYKGGRGKNLIVY